MSPTQVADEIVSLEKKYWDAMKENDVNAAIKMTQFPCVIAGPSGAKRVDEPEYRKLMSSHDGSQFKGIEIEAPEVNLLNDDTAVITYQTHFNKMNMLDVSTWVRSSGSWQCAFHSEHPIETSKS